MTKNEAKILIKYYADIIVGHNLDDDNLGIQLKRMLELHQIMKNEETEA
jgi:hypothetical protein